MRWWEDHVTGMVFFVFFCCDGREMLGCLAWAGEGEPNMICIGTGSGRDGTFLARGRIGKIPMPFLPSALGPKYDCYEYSQIFELLEDFVVTSE